MRIITICLILLLALFAGHCVLDRMAADKNLSKATALLPANPMGAYRTMHDVLGYNRMIALGKIGEVEQKFLKAIEEKIVYELSMKPAPADAFPQAEQALTALDQMNKQTLVDVSKQRLAIVKAAKDAVPLLREKGSLKAWDNMISMFQNISANNMLMAAAFEDFNQWYDQQKNVERRPIGLRDALKGSAEAIGQALNEIQLRAASEGENTIVVAAPPRMQDEPLIAAEKALAGAQGVLDNFQALFGEKEIPPELCGVQAKIAFNRAALRLAHFQDRIATIAQTGSDFMAEFLVRSDTSEVPSAGEMVSMWMQTAEGEFRLAERNFSQAASIDENMRKAFIALSIWMQGDLHLVVNKENPQQWRVRAMQAAAGVSGPALELVQSLPKATRSMLIVKVP